MDYGFEYGLWTFTVCFTLFFFHYVDKIIISLIISPKCYYECHFGTKYLSLTGSLGLPYFFGIACLWTGFPKIVRIYSV